MPHTHLLYDYTVAVYVVRKNRVLFIRHSKNEAWLPVSGHIEMDEDPEGAALRLIDEQVGAGIELIGVRPELSDSRPAIAPSYMSVYEAEHPHQHIALVYFAEADSMVVAPDDEGNEYSWISMNELSYPAYSLADSQIFYAQQALHDSTKA